MTVNFQFQTSRTDWPFYLNQNLFPSDSIRSQHFRLASLGALMILSLFGCYLHLVQPLYDLEDPILGLDLSVVIESCMFTFGE